MIIDFHTHVFPDKIAKKTIDFLAQKAHIPPFSDGSVSGLIREMEKGGADIAITLPVLTNPSQFDSVNRYAADINKNFRHESKQLISFAGIHPKCDNLYQKMVWIRENGFLGVKIHPDYQETYINDDGYIKILEAAKELDLIVITHAGVDGGYRERPVMCPPCLAKEVIRKVGHKKFVLAHYGGNEMIDDVIDMLCGENVYFDTAYILRYIGEDTFKKILRQHGEDKILFASDSPWSNIGKDIEIIKSFSLDKKTEEKIFCENAKKLLGI